MKLEGSFVVTRPAREVWLILNDPEVLRKAIPGCEELVPTPSGYTARAAVAIGPIKARFSGDVRIEDRIANRSLKLVGDGSGGIAGFVNGEAVVMLSDHPHGCEVNYSSEVKIGGKLAQLGSRLIASTSRKLAEQFFSKINEIAADPREVAIAGGGMA
ncbi:CoxG family protein [Mesorhizobium sp. L-8-3]|uniref:CoxG family protein n=1 Tax=Mesorhizobium sp. L-8-3 TaxID=2744522 RepID=UPI0019295616|nr:carbon monoxide dehydrogenase subunit G [Mesorhizobium sp. L-8-3]BCH21492.1 hypothetical protein MesoLjLb_12770 [Mesorhizobium sp. L-8-3]